MKNKMLDTVSMWLSAIGGLAWLSIGLFNYNFVSVIFGAYDKLIYILIGLSAAYIIDKAIRR